MERSASSLLSWLLVPVAAMLVASAVSLPQLPYTGLVMHGAEVITVLPDGPGARAGAREGDRVLWVFDGDGRHDADRLLTGASPGRPLTLLVARGAARRSLWLVPATLPDGDRRMDAMLLLVASGFVLIGGWVWSERRDPLTRAFFLMCIGFAWLLPQTPPWGPRLAAALYRVAQSAATVYLPSLFIHFFALFPDRHPRGGLSAVVRLGYVVGTALFAASLVVLIGHQVEVPLGPLEAALQTAAALWFAAGVLVAFVLFAAPFARAGSGDARRRLRVAFAGTLLGAGPLAAFILIRNTAPSVPLPGERAVVLLTLLVPASFAWATVVHAVFDFRVALRIGAVTLLLAGFGAALYAFGEWLAATWWPHLGAGIAGGALALVALGACVAGPLAPWMRSLGSRVLPEIEPTSLAAWVAREPDLRELSMERMLHEACAAMQRYLRIDGCALVTFDPQEARAVAGVGTLGGTVAATVPALDLEPVRTAGVCALDESDLAPPARQAFERAGVRWLLPVGGDPLRGLALLGRRLAGSWLGRHEVFELERFA